MECHERRSQSILRYFGNKNNDIVLTAMEGLCSEASLDHGQVARTSWRHLIKMPACGAQIKETLKNESSIGWLENQCKRWTASRGSGHIL